MITSILLLCAIIFLWLSGIVMLYGSWLPWLFDLHRYTGFALILLIPFQAATIYRNFSHEKVRTVKRGIVVLNSVILATLCLLIITLGVMWMWRLGPYSTLKQPLLTWHWILGVLIMPFVALHTWQHWSPPRQADLLTRRSLLKVIGLAGASFVLGRAANLLAEAQATGEMPRRFTGSRGFGLFSGNDFPSTGESTINIDPHQWQLVIDGAVDLPLVLTYKDLLAMQSQVMTEAIDCHNGWYSLQEWGGIPLAVLLDKAKAKQDITGVRMISATGLSNTYTRAEVSKILLATHVSGEVLDPSHGYPLRAVVPGRRAWFWLKWLTRVEVLLDPLEVVSGIVRAPWQVFRELNGPRVSTDIH